VNIGLIAMYGYCTFDVIIVVVDKRVFNTLQYLRYILFKYMLGTETKVFRISLHFC